MAEQRNPFDMPPPLLPDWIARREKNEELSRPTAEQIEESAERQFKRSTLTYVGHNSVIPVVYGEQVVGGPVIGGPEKSGGEFIYAVALCWAGDNGIERIEDIRLGDTIQNVSGNYNFTTGAQISFDDDFYIHLYDGSQTTVNSQMASAISGFDDKYEGIAYAVIRMRSSFSLTLTTLPEITFRVKGRKCKDPRTNAVAWTENPVLHMYDFVTNDEFGMGVDLIGAEAAADISDQMYGPWIRNQTGMVFQEPVTQEAALASLSLYAEVLSSYDGKNVSIIPDAKVDTIYPVEGRTIRKDSLRLTTVGLEQVPTLLRVMFTDKDRPEWSSRPAEVQIPEQTMHGMPQAPSTVELPGVYNRLEAERRAYQRLIRLQTPGRVEWQMTAPGLQYQAGDVLRLPKVRGLENINVRLMSQPQMLSPSLYQLQGEIYREQQYPSFPEGTNIPLGGIMILRGSGDIPVGWEQFASGVDRMVCEGPLGSFGSIGNTQISADIETVPDHTGLAWNETYPYPFYQGEYSYEGVGVMITHTDSLDGPAGSHTHNDLSRSVSLNFRRTLNKFRFVKKISEVEELDSNICFLGSGELPASSGYIEANIGEGYLALSGNETRETVGSSSGSFLTNTAGDHDHIQTKRYYPMDVPDKAGAERMSVGGAESAGKHRHTVNYTLSGQLRSFALTLFQSLGGEVEVPEGAIIGWEDENPPEGWALCDGLNGTVNLADYFIYITTSSKSGVVKFSDSLFFVEFSSQTTRDGGHQHRIVKSVRNFPGVGPPTSYLHHDSITHQHAVTQTSPAQVEINNFERYQLRFIQYVGD